MMLTRSQSFPPRMPFPRVQKKVSFDETRYSLIIKNEMLETKRVNKQLCFLVNTDEGEEWWSIDEFVNGEEFTDTVVCDWVNYKNEIADKFPRVRRRCLMCNTFSLHGFTICGRCKSMGRDRYIYG